MCVRGGGWGRHLGSIRAGMTPRKWPLPLNPWKIPVESIPHALLDRWCGLCWVYLCFSSGRAFDAEGGDWLSSASKSVDTERFTSQLHILTDRRTQSAQTTRSHINEKQ